METTTNTIQKAPMAKYVIVGTITFAFGILIGVARIAPSMIPIPCINTVLGSATVTTETNSNIVSLQQTIKETGVVSGIVTRVEGRYVVVRSQTPEQIKDNSFKEYKVLVTDNTKITKLSLKNIDPTKVGTMAPVTKGKSGTLLLPSALSADLFTFTPATLADITTGSIIATAVKEEPRMPGEFVANEVQFQEKIATSTPPVK